MNPEAWLARRETNRFAETTSFSSATPSGRSRLRETHPEATKLAWQYSVRRTRSGDFPALGGRLVRPSRTASMR